MTTTPNNTRSVSFAKFFGRVFATALLLISLATTGCDTLDSNAIEDEPGINATSIRMMPSESFHQAVISESSCVKVKQGGSYACLNEDAPQDPPVRLLTLPPTPFDFHVADMSNMTPRAPHIVP